MLYYNMGSVIPLDKMDMIISKLEQMESKYDNGFEQLNQRINGIDQRLDSIDNHIGKMDERINALDERVTTIDKRIDKMDSRIDKLDHHMDTMDKRISNLELATKEIADTVNRMERTQTEDILGLLIHTKNKADNNEYMIDALNKRVLKTEADILGLKSKLSS